MYQTNPARLTALVRHGCWALIGLGVLLIGCERLEENRSIVTKSNAPISDDVKKFHAVIRTGSIEDVRQALAAGADVNAPGHCGETALMVAIAAGDLAKMKLIVERGADLELTNDFNATALRNAVEYDFVAGVRYLLSLGVERGYEPKYPLKKIDYHFDSTQLPMPAELESIMSEQEWRASMRDSQEMIAEMNENPTIEPVVTEVDNLDILKLLIAAGDDLNRAPKETKRLFVGLENFENDGKFQAAPADFRRYRLRQFGKKNPEPMDNPFWHDMIRIGCNAYQAREHFGDRDAVGGDGAIWCYDRFGSSITPLGDGRFVQIGGEHEDFYDPDFAIYNDVVIHDGSGGFHVFGYPAEVFPPTDFHSATLVDGSIYIIGCLGYPEQRQPGQTPVYRLDVDTWKIEAVATTGEMPSWIHSHRAKYDAKANVIQVEAGDVWVSDANGATDIVKNEDRFELDLPALVWRRLR